MYVYIYIYIYMYASSGKKHLTSGKISRAVDIPQRSHQPTGAEHILQSRSVLKEIASSCDVRSSNTRSFFLDSSPAVVEVINQRQKSWLETLKRCSIQSFYGREGLIDLIFYPSIYPSIYLSIYAIVPISLSIDTWKVDVHKERCDDMTSPQRKIKNMVQPLPCSPWQPKMISWITSSHDISQN